MSETSLKTVRVSEKGQITIPRDIQILLGLKKGDRLVLVTKSDKLLIQKASGLEKQMEDDFDDLLAHSEKTLEQLWLNKEDDIWDKYLQ